MTPPRLGRRAPVLHVADDRGTGPVVVLIHGIASSAVTFQNLVPLLEPTHRCISVDLLGFGGSPMPEGAEYTLAEHVDALAATVRSLRLSEPFTLVGHSMGGLIAPRYAARHRRRVNRLVLISPPIYVDPRSLSDPRDQTRQDLYLRLYRYLRDNRDLTLRQGRVVGDLLPIPRAMDINARTWVPFVKSLEHVIESQTTLSDLASLRIPVRILYGVLDEFASPGGIRIAERLEGVEVTRVHASDHLIGRRLARAAARAVDGGGSRHP
jgi:cis-3-alkyl-4-acyloxetan-2-one decarboxylase